MISVIWRRVGNLNTAYIVEDLGLYSSLCLYPMIKVLKPGVNPLSHNTLTLIYMVRDCMYVNTLQK